MTTTFQSRELVRDELVTLFTSNGSWQNVYGYFPSPDEIMSKTPLLMIRGRGTRQVMEGVFKNPATYRFSLTSMVLAYSESDNWTTANAEDKLDELDKVVRQVIRNNTAALTYADNLEFEDSPSTVSDPIIEGLPYILETRIILAHLVAGSKP